MNYCPYCGERVDASVRYCPKCGTRIPRAEPPPSQTAYQPPPPPPPAYQQPPQQPYYQAPYAETRYKRDEKYTIAVILSLIGAVFILMNGLLLAAVGTFFLAMFGSGLWMVILGLAFGFGTMLGALMLTSNPHDHVIWGAVIIIFSLMSLVIGGGFIIGTVFGLIGGVLALVSGS